MRLTFALLASAGFGLAGCGSFLPGTITSQDGRQLQFEIEESLGNGAVKATDPKTQEQFTGKYVAIDEAMIGTTNVFTPSGSVSGFSVARSNIANANALLAGDKGSTLTCNMQIQSGWSPHGIGTCVDQKGVNYQLQF